MFKLETDKNTKVLTHDKITRLDMFVKCEYVW